HVVDPDLAGHHVDAAVEVDREVAQGMRGRGRRRPQDRDRDQREERKAASDQPHAAPPSFVSVACATGAYWIEKCGLMSSASVSRRRACVRSPNFAWIIPAWNANR